MIDESVKSDEPRKIIITDQGVQISGRWRIGELLAAAQALTNTVNAFEISETPRAGQVGAE